jgi:hypothetical protein
MKACLSIQAGFFATLAHPDGYREVEQPALAGRVMGEQN